METTNKINGKYDLSGLQDFFNEDPPEEFAKKLTIARHTLIEMLCVIHDKGLKIDPVDNLPTILYFMEYFAEALGKVELNGNINPGREVL